VLIFISFYDIFPNSFAKQLEGYFVTQFNIFIIRAVFGAVFAVVLTRMFYGKVEIVYVAGLAVFLVGMAYVMEYFKKKRQK
jgi:hypothetical protein